MNSKKTESISIDPTTKKFVCSYPGCNQIFKTKFSCKRHNLTHTKEKAYICNECGKKFALIQHLKEHSYRHSKQKPYNCGILGCTQSFRHASELSLHRRTHPEYKLRKYENIKSQCKINESDQEKGHTHDYSKDTEDKHKDLIQDSLKRNLLPKEIMVTS